MKLLLLLGTLIAVHSLNYPDGPESKPPVDGEQNQLDKTEEYGSGIEASIDNEGKLIFASEHENLLTHDEPEEYQPLKDNSMYSYEVQENKEQDMDKLRRLRCKARNACVVMGGFCVTNSTLCSGRLVAEGCKGTNCQCCVPDTLENKMTDLEMQIGSMQDNITNDNMKLNLEVKSMKDNLTRSISKMDSKLKIINEEQGSMQDNITDDNMKLKLELKSLKENMTRSMSNMDSKLNTINEHKGCPTGFFQLISSKQCFRLFNDTTRTWTLAEAKCHTEGLVLAEPADPVSVTMHLVKKYGISTYTWLGGKGDGSYIRWQRNGEAISSSKPFWYSGQPGTRVSSSYCLRILTNSNYISAPMYAMSCSSSFFTLCELVTE